MTFFCVEILGESSFHKVLVQSGWSGKDYVFHFNRHTHSHMRAYRHLADYHAERVDLHKTANVWPLLGNLVTEAEIEPHVFVDSELTKWQGPKPLPEVEIKQGAEAGVETPKRISASSKSGK